MNDDELDGMNDDELRERLADLTRKRDDARETIKVLELSQEKGDEWAIRAGTMIVEEEYERRIKEGSMPLGAVVRFEMDGEFVYVPWYNGELVLKDDDDEQEAKP